MTLKPFISRPSLKHYILLLTILPALFITTILTIYLIVIRQADAQDALVQQGTSAIHYLSKASELAFFSGDKEVLRRLAKSTETNVDIQSVTFIDSNQAEILTVGSQPENNLLHSVTAFYKEERGSQWIFQMPVLNSQIEVADFSETDGNERTRKTSEFLGWVQIIANKSRLQQRQNSILITGALIGYLGFSLLAFLALKFSYSITLPLEKITKTVRRLESGDFSARVNVLAKGEMDELIYGIDRLAEKVEISNQSMQKRVEIATTKLTQTLDTLEQKNKELEKTGKELSDANKSKDDFLARVSHELRTPLTSILGYCRLLKKSKLEQKQSDHVNIIHQASTLLLSLIDNILDFTKLQFSSIQLESKAFNLDSLMKAVLDLHTYATEEKGLELLLIIEPDVPLNLLGDELRIKQIINNLLCNAIKFTQYGRVDISISLLKDEHIFGLQFMIQDTGIGMSNKELSQLFQPFYQADPSISRRFGGTGLGLVICKKLVNLMGGEISVSSKRNRGTDIAFTLTKLKQQKKKEKNTVALDTKSNSLVPIENQKQSPALSDVTILVAEDNHFNNKLLEMIFEAQDANVISVENGKKAVDKYHSNSIDLIIMDYHMPVMDGLEACKIIRQSDDASKEIPILLLTADIINIDKNDLLKYGINEVIHKPINEEDLLESVVALTSQNSTNMLLQGKVLDFVPDELILKEIKRLSQLLKFNAKQNEKMKKYAHELCGVVGPTSKFGRIEKLARQLEISIAEDNGEQIEQLVEELTTDKSLIV